MATGTVKWFSIERGFGFIDSAGKDYFVYYRDIHREGFKKLTEGESVKFTESKNDKGLVAKDVIPLHPE